MRRLIFNLMLALTLIVIDGSCNLAAAEDYYIGDYPDGRTAYLMTETIEDYLIYGRNGMPEGREYHCIVKAVSANGGAADFDNYIVYWTQLAGISKNGRQYSRQELYGLPESSVERRLMEYIGKLHRQHHGNSW